VLLAVLVLAGCAGSQAGDGGGISASDPPTLSPPAAPPTSPSDPRPPKDVLVGRIVRGGSGPCYGLETDEGKQYALYSDAGMSLDVGTTVRVQTAPLQLKIDCGPGEHLSAVKIDRVG
jgi:hypothetical protein